MKLPNGIAALVLVALGACAEWPGESPALRGAAFITAGGEPGAGSVAVEIRDSGELRYRRVPDYTGDWQIVPVDRALALTSSQTSAILDRLQALPLERLHSDVIPCCDYVVSQLSTRSGAHQGQLRMIGQPCAPERPQAWLDAWSEICPLLLLAEPEYWKERGCLCAER